MAERRGLAKSDEGQTSASPCDGAVAPAAADHDTKRNDCKMADRMTSDL